MATTHEDVAINEANIIMSLVGQIKGIRAAAAEMVTINAANPFGSAWNILNTTVLSSDGGLGTADTPGTPVNGHYIDPRLYPNIARLITNTDLANALQIIVDFQAFCAGTAVASTPGRPAAMDAVTG